MGGDRQRLCKVFILLGQLFPVFWCAAHEACEWAWHACLPVAKDNADCLPVQAEAGM